MHKSLSQGSRSIGLRYGGSTASRINKIVGLFCKKTLQKRQYSPKETYNLIDPTNRSHPDPTNRSHPIDVSARLPFWEWYVYCVFLLYDTEHESNAIQNTNPQYKTRTPL